ncbi:heme-binding domain-containing protein [Corallibacter vietnamensis]|uniref:Heme-binding domain-containing protein n=1 Tax=Corallibacter vietnamensis TaxID=904130 RepID=A0ABP7H711_9FLAO
MKVVKKILLGLLLVFLVAQFFRPEKNQGDITSIDEFLADTNPPEHVKVILKESCFDCHSNVTRYPWYSQITPVNYWMADHVNHGKGEFNVANWDGNSVKRKDHKFEELIEEVKNRKMPLESYTWAHANAKLSDKQIKAIVDWAEQVRFKYSLMPKPE